MYKCLVPCLIRQPGNKALNAVKDTSPWRVHNDESLTQSGEQKAALTGSERQSFPYSVMILFNRHIMQDGHRWHYEGTLVQRPEA